MSASLLQLDHQNVRGTILYTSRKPERLGQERGREYLIISVHADGSRSRIAGLKRTAHDGDVFRLTTAD